MACHSDGSRESCTRDEEGGGENVKTSGTGHIDIVGFKFSLGCDMGQRSMVRGRNPTPAGLGKKTGGRIRGGTYPDDAWELGRAVCIGIGRAPPLPCLRGGDLLPGLGLLDDPVLQHEGALHGRHAEPLLGAVRVRQVEPRGHLGQPLVQLGLELGHALDQLRLWHRPALVQRLLLGKQSQEDKQ